MRREVACEWARGTSASQLLRLTRVPLTLDGTSEPLPEVGSLPEVPRVAEFHDGPQFGQPVLHRRTRQCNATRGLEGTDGRSLLGGRILDVLCLVEHDTMPVDRIEAVLVPNHEGVGGDEPEVLRSTERWQLDAQLALPASLPPTCSLCWSGQYALMLGTAASLHLLRLDLYAHNAHAGTEGACAAGEAREQGRRQRLQPQLQLQNAHQWRIISRAVTGSSQWEATPTRRLPESMSYQAYLGAKVAANVSAC